MLSSGIIAASRSTYLVTSTVTMGTLSNVSYGSGYGYSAGYFSGGSSRTGGSNPNPTSITIHGESLPHPHIGEYTQFGSRYFTIEIDFTTVYTAHPDRAWLASVNIADGQGNSVEIDTSSFNRNNHTQNNYYSRGARYERGYGTNAPALIDTTNNNKTLTWEFIL
jgi:hypothetical protein